MIINNKTLLKHPLLLDDTYSLKLGYIPHKLINIPNDIFKECEIIFNVADSKFKVINIENRDGSNIITSHVNDAEVFYGENFIILDFISINISYIKGHKYTYVGRMLFYDNKIEIYTFDYSINDWALQKPAKFTKDFAECLDSIKYYYHTHFEKFKLYFQNTTRYILGNDKYDYYYLYSHVNSLLSLYVLFYSLSINPAMALVYNEFPDNIENLCIKGVYDKLNINIKYFLKYQVFLENCEFDYTATNVKDFLKVNKTVYKWIKTAQLNLNYISIFSENSIQEWKYLMALNSNKNFNNVDISASIREFFKLTERDKKMVYLFITNINHKYPMLNNINNLLLDYIDYINMCNNLSIEPKTKFTINNFYLEHDLLSGQIKISKNASQEKIFKEVNENLNLLYSMEINGYIFLFPKSLNDLTREGNLQRHCVATYYEKVVSKKSYIVFLRKISEINTPLVTIEVDMHLRNCIQARGYANRATTSTENYLIDKWFNYIKDVKSKKQKTT